MVRASDIAAMLDGDIGARDRVDEAVLLRKAVKWDYEQEWRLIGHRGQQGSPLEMEEIIFGMRCESSTKYAVMKALECRDRAVEFYELCEERGTFNLRKEELSRGGELLAQFPDRHLSLFEGLEVINDDALSLGGR